MDLPNDPLTNYFNELKGVQPQTQDIQVHKAYPEKSQEVPPLPNNPRSFDRLNSILQGAIACLILLSIPYIGTLMAYFDYRETSKNLAQMLNEINTKNVQMLQSISPPPVSNQIALPSNLPLQALSQSIRFLPTNMIINSSFESGINGSTPRAWSYIGNSGNSNTQVNNASVHSGSLALELNDSSCANTGNCQLGISQADTQTVNGRDYVLSVWVRVPGYNPSTVRIGLFGVVPTSDPNYGTAYFSTYSQDRYQDFDLSNLKPNTWTRLEASFENVPLGKYPIIQVNYQGGAIYIDDIALSEGQGAQPASMSEISDAFPYEQTNVAIGDNTLVAQTGSIFPISSFTGASIGSDSNRFGSIYLTNFTVDSNGNVWANGGISTAGLFNSTYAGTSTFSGSLDIGGNLTIDGSISANGIIAQGGLQIPSGDMISFLPTPPGTTNINLQGERYTSWENNVSTTFDGIKVYGNSGLVARFFNDARFSIWDSNTFGGPAPANPADGDAFAFSVYGDIIAGDFNTWTTAQPGAGFFNSENIARRIGENITNDTAPTYYYSHKALNTDAEGGAYIMLQPDWGNGGGDNSGFAQIVAYGRGGGADANSIMFLSRNGVNSITERGRFDSTGLRIASGHSINFAGDGSLYLPNGIIEFGGDTQIFRGTSNRLDLASGDSLNIVNGNITFPTGGSKVGQNTTTNYLSWTTGNLNLNSSGQMINLNLDTDNDSSSTSFNVYTNAVDAGGTQLLSLSEAGQLALPITGPTGGIVLGGNAQLFQGATNRLDIASGDSLRITNPSSTNWIEITGDHITTPGTGPGSGFQFNTVELYSGTTDRLDLASGDSLNIVAGNVSIASGQRYYFKNTDSAWYIGHDTTPEDILLGGSGSGTRAFKVIDTGNSNQVAFSTEFDSGNTFILGTLAAGVTTVDATQTIGTSEGLCWGGSGADEATIEDCNSAPTDLAENFGTDDASIEAGDIVSLDPGKPAETVTINGSQTSKAFVIKTQNAYQATALGIVSTAPNQVFGGDGLFDQSENPRPVSLAGRVPVKVNNEGGPIAVGDYITSSSVPGVGMKATQPGRVIGIAMQPFVGTDQGKIEVFVNPTWHDPRYDLDTNGNLNIASIETDKIVLKGHDLGQLIGLPEENQEQSEENQEEPATPPATIDPSILERISSLENLIATLTPGENSGSLPSSSSASFDELNVAQKLLTNDLGITGNISMGLLTVKGLDDIGSSESAVTINTLGSDLYLQNNLLGGINILNGKVIVDKDGNVKIENTIKAKKYDVDTSDSASSSLGKAVLPAGQTSITINTTAVSGNSSIFVTPETVISLPLVVSEKTAGQNFKVEVANPIDKDVNFSWWIVN